LGEGDVVDAKLRELTTWWSLDESIFTRDFKVRELIYLAIVGRSFSNKILGVLEVLSLGVSWAR